MSSYKTQSNKGIDWAALARHDERKLYRNCKGCKHLAQDWTCRYLLDMGPGHSRVKMGVKTRPGGGCDLYAGTQRTKTSVRPGIILTKGAARKMREIARVAPGPLEGKPEAEKIALELYQKGAGDTQIANTVGITRNAVKDWRQANGLESNHLKFRKENPL